MVDVQEHIESTNKKLSLLNDFISLSLRRGNISKDLERLASETTQIQDLLARAHNLMQEELNNYKYEYEELMSRMRRKQIQVMGYIIKQKQRKIKEYKQEQQTINLVLSSGKPKINLSNSVHKSAVKLLGHNISKISLNHALCVTPKIKISEYKESPLVKKISRIPFVFEEFDVTITQQQFDTIPKYMCGRETLDQLNTFLENIIIPCFNEKYRLMHKQRSCVKNLQDLELWKLYNEQASYLPDRMFITPGDLTRKLNKMLDKKTQNRIVMLRHIGILNELRVKQTVCYAWSYRCHQ